MSALSKHILVVGGGPAAATTAFWLARAGFEVVIAERASRHRFSYGQGIDLTGLAIESVKLMGLFERKIQNVTTDERGFALVDDESKIIASFGAGAGATLTQEIELMRGDLTRLLAEAAGGMRNVDFRYDCTISTIDQGDTDVEVVLQEGSHEV